MGFKFQKTNKLILDKYLGMKNIVLFKRFTYPTEKCYMFFNIFFLIVILNLLSLIPSFFKKFLVYTNQITICDVLKIVSGALTHRT